MNLLFKHRETPFDLSVDFLCKTRLVFDSSDHFGHFLVLKSSPFDLLFHIIVFQFLLSDFLFIRFLAHIEFSKLVFEDIDLLHVFRLLLLLVLNVPLLLLLDPLQHPQMLVDIILLSFQFHDSILHVLNFAELKDLSQVITLLFYHILDGLKFVFFLEHTFFNFLAGQVLGIKLVTLVFPEFGQFFLGDFDLVLEFFEAGCLTGTGVSRRSLRLSLDCII